MAQELLPVNAGQTPTIALKASGESPSAAEQPVPFRDALQVAMDDRSQGGGPAGPVMNARTDSKEASKGEGEKRDGKDTTEESGTLSARLPQVSGVTVDLSALFVRSVMVDAPSQPVSTEGTSIEEHSGEIRTLRGSTTAPGTNVIASSAAGTHSAEATLVTDALAGLVLEQRQALDEVQGQSRSRTDGASKATTDQAYGELVAGLQPADGKEAATVTLSPAPSFGDEQRPAADSSRVVPARPLISTDSGPVASPSRPEIVRGAAGGGENQALRSGTGHENATPREQPLVDTKTASAGASHHETTGTSSGQTVEYREEALKSAAADLAGALSTLSGDPEPSGDPMVVARHSRTGIAADASEGDLKPDDPGETVQRSSASVFAAGKKTADVSSQVQQTGHTKEQGDALQGWRFQAPATGAQNTVGQSGDVAKETVATQAGTLPAQLARSIVDQVIKGVTLTVTEAHQEMRMTLKPESLGEMTLQVKLSEGKLHAQIDVSQQAVKNVIEANMADLRVALQDRGIDVQRIEVFASGQSNNVADGQGNRSGRFKQRGGRRQESVSSVEELKQARSMGYNTLEVTM
jgi:flagellar hook-length control protein FliK